jgi:predicted dehydrogenase
MSRSTRRQFLEDSLLAAAAAAIPGGAVRAALRSQAAKKRGPNELLGVAIVGVNGRGGEHVRLFLEHPETEIRYVVDADEKIGRARAAQIAREQDRPPKYVSDMRRAFDDPQVDLVSTATPNHWHALVAIWAMEAGKDVYVEKPVSHDVREGRLVIETARRLGRVCQAGTQNRSAPAVIEAIGYVRSGKIGAVALARGLCYKRRPSIGPKGSYPPPAGVDYDLWTGPAPLLPVTRPQFHYDWHWQRTYGNGDMGNQGPHQMDIARWGLGLDCLADRVLAFGGRLGYRDAGDTANTEVGLFEFALKSIVFEVRGLPTPAWLQAHVGTIFYGSEGYVVVASLNAKDATGKAISSGAAAFDPRGKLLRAFRSRGDDAGLHFDNFIQAAKARNPALLRADIREGHLSCAHSHLANVSYYLAQPASVGEIRRTLSGWKTHENTAELVDRTVGHLEQNGVDLNKTPMALGPALTIDKSRETVLDNPQAVALLSRPFRAPFAPHG